MTVLYLTSAKGAPGTTTTALALAFSWPRKVLVVEADPAGSSILPGYLRGGIDHAHGLTNVSLATRQGTPVDVAALDESLRLTDDVFLLPGVADPAQAPSLTTTWPALASALPGYEAAAIDVIVDAGRYGNAYAPLPLLRTADVVALTTRTQLPDIYALSRRAPAITRELGEFGATDALRVLTIGPGRPYSDKEIQDSVGAPILASIAWDPDNAAHFSVGAPKPRRFTNSQLMRSAAAAVSMTIKLADDRRRRLAATVSTTGDPTHD